MSSVFVYGTLRPGQVNYPIVSAAVTEQVPARLDDHALRAAVTAGVPTEPSPGHQVCELLRLERGAETDLLGVSTGWRLSPQGGQRVALHPGPGSNTWAVRKTLGPFRRLYRARPQIDRLRWDAAIAIRTHPVGDPGRPRPGAGIPNRCRATAVHPQRRPRPSHITSHRNLSDHEPFPDITATDAGWTDSHRLFSAIATAHAQPHGLTDTLVKVLSSVHGRAALAWTDTSRPDHGVWLVRGGLSPLAVGIDPYGGLWWASNPARLREMAEYVDLRITISLLPEGSLWSLTPHQRHVSCTRLAGFKPTVRTRDEAIARIVVWRGFSSSDRADDKTLLHHRTLA